MTKSIALLSAFLTVLFSATVFGQSGGDKVQVVAFANQSTIQPGKPFWVGFKFTVEPSWHIYWTNPGDSGLATQVKLKLPDGFTAGELQYPVPQRLTQPGDVVNYGYENEVMLLAQITPPKDLAPGPVKLGAKATWLVCKEECMPGGATLSLEIPAGDSASAANEDLFKEWMGRLPVKQDAEDIAGSSMSTSIVDGNGTAAIKISWKKSTADIQFIPGTMKTGDIADVKVVTVENATTVTFSIKNSKDPDPITGLVTYTKPDGSKTALEISIPSTMPTK